MSGFVRDFGLDGRPVLLAFESGDNETIPRTIDVPEGRIWCVHYIGFRIVTSAVVGNRQLQLQLDDPRSTEVWRRNVGAVQAASTTRNYHFGPDLPDDVAFGGNAANTQMRSQIPLFWMGPNRASPTSALRSNLTIQDEANIDAADRLFNGMIALIEYKDDDADDRLVRGLP